MRLLVVDDQPLARTLISKVFEADGYDCRTAGSLVEAEEAVATDTVDGMVIDVELQGENGVSWLEQVSRERPRLTQKTVVATSADLGANDRRRVAALGAVLLLRPFSVETLRSIVIDLTRNGIDPPSALPRAGEDPAARPERRRRERGAPLEIGERRLRRAPTACT